MRKLLLVLLLIASLPAFCAVPVTGNLKDIATGAVTSGTFARFELQNCGGFVPRVTGTSVLVRTSYDFRPGSTGAVSGNLYANNEIDCGGNTDTTWYNLTIYYNNVKTGQPIPVKVYAPGFNLNSYSACTTCGRTPTPPPPTAQGYIYQTPTGDQTIVQPAGTNFRISGSVEFSAANIANVNGVVNAAKASGADICAAISAQPSFTPVFVPAGSYTCSHTMALGPYVSVIAPAGAEQTKITYTGNGAAVTTSGGNSISGISLIVGSSATDGFKLKGSNVTLENFYVEGGGASTKIIHVAAASGTDQSGKVHVRNGIGFGLVGTGLYVDHVIDAFLTSVDLYAASGNTATGMVIDTGVSGAYLTDVSVGGFAQGGLIVKDSSPGAGGYNQWPNYLKFHNFIADCANNACAAADGVLFDSSLGTNTLYASFDNSWIAGFGVNGLHISGGRGIKFTAGGKIRENYLNGVLIDNANVSDVSISESFITANNVSNNADAHGVYVSAAVPRVKLIGNTIGNLLDTTGHQKYAFKVSAVNADYFTAIGNDLKENESGYYSNADTGTYNVLSNTSDAGESNTESTLWGTLQLMGDLYGNAGIYGASISGTHIQISGVDVVDSTKRGIFTEVATPKLSGITDTSTVTNLNADLLDGKHAADFANSSGGSPTKIVCWKADGKTLGYATMAAGDISACN